MDVEVLYVCELTIGHTAVDREREGERERKERPGPRRANISPSPSNHPAGDVETAWSHTAELSSSMAYSNNRYFTARLW